MMTTKKHPTSFGRVTVTATVFTLLLGISGVDANGVTFHNGTLGECYVEDGCSGALIVPEEIYARDCICLGGGSFQFVNGGQYCAWTQNPLNDLLRGRALEESNTASTDIMTTTHQHRRELGYISSVVVFYVCTNLDRKRRGLGAPGCTAYTLTALCESDIVGEPHIKQLLGGWYDFQGECDLVYTHAPAFGGDIGLDIHARTKIRYDYSYIQSLAIAIGSEILEIAGFGHYLLDGVSEADPSAMTLSGYPIQYNTADNKQYTFEIDLGGNNTLHVTTMKDIVSLKIKSGGGQAYGPDMHEWFGNSTGLMGSLQSSKKIARDGVTVLEDPNEMGQEWQVVDSDPKLFQNPDRAPQYPQKCILPDTTTKDKRRRRLAETIPRDVAEKACEGWSEAEKENCIYDLIATGDLELAQAGAY